MQKKIEDLYRVRFGVENSESKIFRAESLKEAAKKAANYLGMQILKEICCSEEDMYASYMLTDSQETSGFFQKKPEVFIRIQPLFMEDDHE